MRISWLKKIINGSRAEKGSTFIEVLIALALLGIIAVAFLSGLATTSKASIISDEQTTAESLAQSQMEWVKKATYVYEATEYSPAPVLGNKDYSNYFATVAAAPLHNPDDGIQKITVTISRSGKELFMLEGYKVAR